MLGARNEQPSERLAKMTDPLVAASNSDTNEPPKMRLVIRAKIISEPAPEIEDQSQLNKRAIAMAAGAVAVLLALGWIAFGSLSSDSATGPQSPPSAALVSAAAPVTTMQPKSTTQASPIPPASPDVESSKSRSSESSLPAKHHASPSPINQVTPVVPRSALQTIRGTIRVLIRVTVDAQGVVVATHAEERGPSRYFERLALDAARKWTFTPASTPEQRSTLVRFNFTREAATARAEPP